MKAASSVGRGAFGAWTMLFGCVLPEVSLEGRSCPCSEGYVCDAATNTCTSHPSSQGGSGGSGNAGGGGAGASGVGGTGGTANGGSGGDLGGSGGTGLIEGGLVVEGSPDRDLIVFSVPDSFRLEADEASLFQITRWFSGADPGVDLASIGASQTDYLFGPFALNLESGWYDPDDGVVQAADLDLELPVRARLNTQLLYDGVLTVTNSQTIFATGRIAYRIVVHNQSGATQMINEVQHSYAAVNSTLPWTRVTRAGGFGGSLTRQNGPNPPSNFLVVHRGPEANSGQDFETNFFWTSGAQELTPNATFIRTGELTVAPNGLSDADLEARAFDGRNPGIASVLGGTITGNGFDVVGGSYALTATQPDITIVMDGTYARHSPAFSIETWIPTEWSLSRAGVTIASSDAPQTDQALTYMGDDHFTFIYRGVIPKGAPEAERTFVLDAP